jgi:hypothetical protein
MRCSPNVSDLAFCCQIRSSRFEPSPYAPTSNDALLKFGDHTGSPSRADATEPASIAGAIPGLTLEQAHIVHGWLAASCDLPRERLGFIAVVAAPSGRYRRRSYLTLAAAQHAVERAEARGIEAGMIMFEMYRPVARRDEPIESAIQPDRDAMRGDLPDLPKQLQMPVECLADLCRCPIGDPRLPVQGVLPSRDGDGE